VRQCRIRFRRRQIACPRFLGSQLWSIKIRRRWSQKLCLARRDLRQVNADHCLLQPLRLGTATIAVPAALPLWSLPEVQADLAVAASARIREPADHAFPLG